ncbi:Uncharacterized conserved protein, DUF1015 family [Treponema bryantii]|uniref:Uncharacterized conserved protein, DUF1015 family n=1 Tax=Treponema bryantii TaxID=163 RepID=A0A1H9CM64_9SPIR|nr:DUF1015 domain-containing protein [Treponema bryantii]SEQ02302.1 Uncharacterized conserved protein, DUF1015 family [Treponema bryantii]
MKKIEDFGLSIPEILLPKNIDVSSWSVIACDQYTQDLDYWKKAEACAAGKPSTLNLILPEVYLNSPDKPERIEKIRKTMKEYIDGGIFDTAKNCLIYIERKTAFGRIRKGLVAQIDLETYEWKPFSKANIRATEATIVERIPPRMEIRRGAPLELPHIMLLVDDKDDLLVGGTGNKVKSKAPLYDGSLMCNGGSITGWAVESENEIADVTEAVSKIADKNRAADGSTFLFAVGDGNHSLATAKAVWDEYKEKLTAQGADEAALKACSVRYALVEIVNIYDTGLTFEPIHRVIFGADVEGLISHLAEKLGGTVSEVSGAAELDAAVKASWADFGFAYREGGNGKQKYVLLKTGIKELAVARLQPEIDAFLKGASGSEKPEIDYIHGSDETLKLGERENAVGILLPPIAKDSFFETINGRGPLPRKSFSMGEADEKRFYLECRKLF